MKSVSWNCACIRPLLANLVTYELLSHTLRFCNMSWTLLFCSQASLASAASTERVELAVLKPLWQLYTCMLKKYGKLLDLNLVTIMWSCNATEDDNQQVDSPVPQIVRALTELFLLVENVAEDWGMAQDHLIDMLTTEGLNTWLEKVGMATCIMWSVTYTHVYTAGYQ